MCKTFFRACMLILFFAVTQTALADNTLINLNSNTREISFDANNKAELTIPADPKRTTISVSLPSGSSSRIVLPWCDNKVVDVDHGVSCPASTDSMTLTFVKENSMISPVVKSAGPGVVGVIIIAALVVFFCNNC